VVGLFAAGTISQGLPCASSLPELCTKSVDESCLGMLSWGISRLGVGANDVFVGVTGLSNSSCKSLLVESWLECALAPIESRLASPFALQSSRSVHMSIILQISFQGHKSEGGQYTSLSFGGAHCGS